MPRVEAHEWSLQICGLADRTLSLSLDDLLRYPQGRTRADALFMTADRLGARSRNAYAHYERGRTVPTVAKLDELLKAVAPDRDLIVGQSNAA